MSIDAVSSFFHKTETDYLKGEIFSNGLILKYSKSKLKYQLDLIPELLTGLNVIHIGCCDHLPIIDEKIQENNWVHGIISQVSKKCLGVDINKSSVDYVKNSKKYTNIICADITKNNIESIIGSKWDCFYLGELIEHIDNPHYFIKTIREKYKDNVNKVVVTTPNAFSYGNCLSALKNKESINSDHRYWFTPYTLAKIFTNAGYRNIRFDFIEPGRVRKVSLVSLLKRPWRVLKIFLLNRIPSFRETIIMTAEL